MDPFAAFLIKELADFVSQGKGVEDNGLIIDINTLDCDE